MNREDIILLAIEHTIHGLKFDEDGLIHFAKLIAKHERKWVGLTNEEITDLYHNENLGQQSAVAQAMALLKERNT